MIFVTVGTQLPFDRLIAAVDHWVEATSPAEEVFAQTGAGSYHPRRLEHTPFLQPDDFQARGRAASIIVAHAGMGSVLTALQFGKPLLVMPRRADLGEHRNDHQVATARHLQRQGMAEVAEDEVALFPALRRIKERTTVAPRSAGASAELLARLSDFVAASPVRRRGGRL